MDTTTFLVYLPGIYVLKYSWPDGSYVQTSHYFYEVPNPEIVGDPNPKTCSEVTYTALDNRTDTFGNLSYQWILGEGSGGTIIGSDTSVSVTVNWDNISGTDTLMVQTHICSPCQCIVGCVNSDTIIVTKETPSFAGQIKYWNEYETYMPTPFTTDFYGTFPEDYFYVTLYHYDGGTYDSLETVVAQPRLMEDLHELMSYFEFDIATNIYGCDAEFVLKVWDGGLCYHVSPPAPPVSGTYVGESYTYRNWGGVNATDALAIQLMVGGAHDIHGAPWNYSWVGSNNDSPQYGYYSHAIADVNSSNTYYNGGITALDALTAKYRAIGLLGSYPNNGSGNIQFSPNFRVTGRMVDSLPEITFPEPFDYDNVDDVPFIHSGNDYLYYTQAVDHKYASYPIPWNSGKDYINIYYEAIGDVNASYVPTEQGFKIIPSTELTYTNVVKVMVDEQIEIPINIDRNATIGAITLGFTYRNDLIEILGTNFDDDNIYLDQEKGILNMAWYSVNGIQLSEGESIAQIKVRVIDKIGSNVQLFKLQPITELADDDAHVIDVDLKTFGISTDITSVVGDELFVTNYPNPFIDLTTFNYILPEKGKVHLVVYGLMGQVVNEVVSKTQEAGSYQVDFDREGMEDGIYFYRLTLETEENFYSATKSLNVSLNPFNQK
jgi:hypothetical protein